MKKKIVIALAGVLALAAILFFIVGPLYIKWIVGHTYAPVTKTSPIMIKANGKLSFVENHVLLTTPNGRNNYVLVGTRENELKQLAVNKSPAFVFGQLMTPDPRKIAGVPIRYRIDVSQFDTKDFEPLKKVSAQVAEAIKRKVEEKIAFREATMKKLKISDKNLDVISGKLVAVDTCIYMADPKEHTGLIIRDKYDDHYFLLDAGALKRPFSQYKTLASTGIDIVVVGRVTLMDPGITTSLPTGSYVPFMAMKIFNADLSEIILENGTEKK